MIRQEIPFKKGKQAAGLKIQSWAKYRKQCGSGIEHGVRYFATNNTSSGQVTKESLAPNGSLGNSQQGKKQYKAIDRDFFLSVLGSSATKREARAYLQRFTPPLEGASSPKKPGLVSEKTPQSSHGSGVNLGALYGTARAVEDSPRFVQQPESQAKEVVKPPLHIALVKIRDPEYMDDKTLHGIGRTLSQLGKLGLTSIVVVDCNAATKSIPVQQTANWRAVATHEAERIITAIDSHGKPGARMIDNVVGVSEKVAEVKTAPCIRGRIHITFRNLLITPLRRGIIPVIPSVGYTDSTQTAVPVKANDIVLALTKELAGLHPAAHLDEDPGTIREQLQALRNEVSLDRLIILDPLGGIPTSDRPNGYHVFLNMEQEFEAAKQDLLSIKRPCSYSLDSQTKENTVPDLGLSNPLSRFVENEFSSSETSELSVPLSEIPEEPSGDSKHQLDNLELVRRVLSLLPSSSSALLTTPDEAANSGREPDRPFQASGVGTRQQLNPLIHNLLTDKPVFSSSLPTSRVVSPRPSLMKEPVSRYTSITPTTFAKHGMSVTIFPDPRATPWEPPEPGKPHLKLTDSLIDLPRLVHLIEDSFNRRLDVKDYLRRVNGRIAGVIIAGGYEGGALLTWELPHGVADDGSIESRARMVPYLDKFAVLKRSQGSGGVADIVFTAMVRDCFPGGVAWRSRRDNPVNKWYFERSRGTWKLPDTNWTMFWTTPELSMNKQMFKDYEGVCRSVVPSWADNKAMID